MERSKPKHGFGKLLDKSIAFSVEGQCLFLMCATLQKRNRKLFNTLPCVFHMRDLKSTPGVSATECTTDCLKTHETSVSCMTEHKR